MHIIFLLESAILRCPGRAVLGFPGGSVVENLPAKQEMQFRSLGQEDPLEKETATQSIILAWEIPWTEEPGMLQSMEDSLLLNHWGQGPRNPQVTNPLREQSL